MASQEENNGSPLFCTDFGSTYLETLFIDLAKIELEKEKMLASIKDQNNRRLYNTLSDRMIHKLKIFLAEFKQINLLIEERTLEDDTKEVHLRITVGIVELTGRLEELEKLGISNEARSSLDRLSNYNIMQLEKDNYRREICQVLYDSFRCLFGDMTLICGHEDKLHSINLSDKPHYTKDLNETLLQTEPFLRFKSILKLADDKTQDFTLLIMLQCFTAYRDCIIRTMKMLDVINHNKVTIFHK